MEIIDKFINLTQNNDKFYSNDGIYIQNIKLNSTPLFQKGGFNAYIERFIKRGKLYVDDLINIYILFERIYNKGFRFKHNQLFKIFAILSIIFMKFYYDFSEIIQIHILVGVLKEDFKEIELFLLNLLDFELFIDNVEYTNTLQKFF